MKKIIIITIVVLLGVALALILIFGRGSQLGSGPGAGTTGTLPPVATSSFVYNPPTGPTFVLGTSRGNVVVNNFYNNAKETSADHTSVLAQETDGYNITYYAPDSSFNVLITQTPFDTVRAQAEAAFLQLLGVSKADACKLNVKIGTMASVDPTHAGQNLGLSFCSGGAFQGK